MTRPPKPDPDKRPTPDRLRYYLETEPRLLSPWERELLAEVRALRETVDAFAEAAETVILSDYTGYTHRLLEAALARVGKGPYDHYGSESEPPQITQLRSTIARVEALLADQFEERTLTVRELRDALKGET